MGRRNHRKAAGPFVYDLMLPCVLTRSYVSGIMRQDGIKRAFGITRRAGEEVCVASPQFVIQSSEPRLCLVGPKSQSMGWKGGCCASASTPVVVDGRVSTQPMSSMVPGGSVIWLAGLSRTWCLRLKASKEQEGVTCNVSSGDHQDHKHTFLLAYAIPRTGEKTPEGARGNRKRPWHFF
jgi:hypothetical protein